MLNKIYDLGLIKYAGDEDKAKEFASGFAEQLLEKMAELPYDKAESPYQSLVQGFSNNMGKGVGSMVVATGISALGNMAKIGQNAFLRTKFLAALEKAIKGSSYLRESDPIKVRDYAETLFHFAPHISTDANLLTSLLANAIQGSGIDPMTIHTVVQLEEKHTNNNSFSPKNFY